MTHARPARTLVAALALSLAPTLAATDIDLGQSRIEEILEHVRSRTIDALVGQERGLAQLPLGPAIRRQAGTVAVVRMLALGEGSPLRPALSAADWAYASEQVPTLATLAGQFTADLRARSYTDLVDAGSLGTQKSLVGTVHLALRLRRQSDDARERADLAFLALGVGEAALHPAFLEALLARSQDPELDEAARLAAGHLYVLCGRTRARLELVGAEYGAQG